MSWATGTTASEVAVSTSSLSKALYSETRNVT